MTFAEKIKLCRQTFGYTQTEMASILGLTRRAIVYYESGKRGASKETLASISKHFKVPLGYLLLDSETEPGDNFYKEAYRVELTRYKDSSITEDVLNRLLAAGGDRITTDDPNWDILRDSIAQIIMESEREAKRKFTPKKWR